MYSTTALNLIESRLFHKPLYGSFYINTRHYTLVPGFCFFMLSLIVGKGLINALVMQAQINHTLLWSSSDKNDVI